jgi:hypothetical protein
VINSVIILFINDLDEQFYELFRAMSPKLAETLKYRHNSGGEQMDYRPSTEEITRHIAFLRSLLQIEDDVEVEGSKTHSEIQTKITEYFGKGVTRFYEPRHGQAEARHREIKETKTTASTNLQLPSQISNNNGKRTEKGVQPT